MCHNFQILMLSSWQRPTHSAELQAPGATGVTHSVVTTFYPPYCLQVLLGFINIKIGLISSPQLQK